MNRINSQEHGVLRRRNFYLPDTLISQLKEIAGSKDISYSELIRQVLMAYAKKATKRNDA